MPADSKPIVIAGGGVHGTALAYMLGRKLRRAKSKQKIILLERYGSPNTYGSSHGDTRITRFANAEAPFLTKTAQASVHEYSELQKRFRESSTPHMARISKILRELYYDDMMFHQTGLLVMGPKGEKGSAHNVADFVQSTIDNAVSAGIDHEVLSGREVAERFPGYMIRDAELDRIAAYYESGSGTLFPERCVMAQRLLAQLYGVQYRPNTEMKGFRHKKDGVEIILRGGATIDAHRLVLATGAWIRDFMPDGLDHYFRIQRQVVGWFHVDEPERMDAAHSPNFIVFQHTDKGIKHNYGFSAQANSMHPGMVKSAFETGAHIGDPADKKLRQVHGAELDEIYNFSSRFIRGMQRVGAMGQSCRYTNEPQGRLIAAGYPQMDTVDSLNLTRGDMAMALPLHELNENDRVVVISACSGHGFKNAMGLAEAVASRMLGQKGKYDIDLADYAWVPPIDKTLVAKLDQVIRAGRLRDADNHGQEKTAGKPGGFNPQ